MEILQKAGSLPIFFIMFLIIYFLMIRPQTKQRNEQIKLINNLKKGDRVIMRDGICGKIIDFNGNDKILLETANESKILFLKSFVSMHDKKS